MALKRLRKERKYSKRQYLQTQIDKLHELKNNNPKQFWQTLENIKSNKKDNPADKIQPGVWYDYLTKKHNSSHNNNNEQLWDEICKTDKTFNELDFPFKDSELKRCISKLKITSPLG